MMKKQEMVDAEKRVMPVVSGGARHRTGHGRARFRLKRCNIDDKQNKRREALRRWRRQMTGLAAGVTALECEGGVVRVIRALTTRTKTGGSADKTYRELTTMLILDELIPALRTVLRAKFARAKNNALTRKAIRNQVVLELQTRVEREVIEGYANLTVTAAEDDRTTCVVAFTFTVTQGLNRILLTAHMNV